MSVFHPTIYLESASALTVERLRELGARGLILDVDNTLTTHGNPVPDPDILRWLDKMHAAGIRMIILSNNWSGRVRPFAGRLGLGFISGAAKPLPFGYCRAAAKLGLGKNEVAVVGDQVFTDILGGNLYGAKTVLVRPIKTESDWFFRLKRRLENGILKKHTKKQP